MLRLNFQQASENERPTARAPRTLLAIDRDR
jgi:hypothetical protein